MYTTSFDLKVDYAFYGLAEQTVAAAHAFEMTYNLVLSWSLKPSIASGIHAKNCYKLGVADGLVRMAKYDKKKEEAQVQEREQALLQSRKGAEEAEEQARILRLADPIVKTEDTIQDVKAEAETIQLLDSGPRNLRVKIEEVEDEDVRLNPSAQTNTQRNTEERSTFIAGNLSTRHDPLGGPIYSSTYMEEASDNEDSNDYDTIHDHDDILPADFHNDDAVDDLIDLDAAELRLKQSTSIQCREKKMGPPLTFPDIPQEPEVCCVKKEDKHDESQLWSSVGQLVAFRETTQAIAEDYLKSQGIKLGKARKSSFAFKNTEASDLYMRGKRDAKKIDVKRKLLKDAEAD